MAQQREADAALKRAADARQRGRKTANRPQERNWMRSEKNWKRWAIRGTGSGGAKQNLLNETRTEAKALEEQRKLLDRLLAAREDYRAAQKVFRQSSMDAESALEKSDATAQTIQRQHRRYSGKKHGGRTAVPRLRQRASSASRGDDCGNQSGCRGTGGRRGKGGTGKGKRERGYLRKKADGGNRAARTGCRADSERAGYTMGGTCPLRRFKKR